MSFLAEAAAADGDGAAEDTGTDATTETPAEGAGEQVQQAEAPRTETVKLPPKPGRRAAAADAVSKQIADLAKTVTESNAQYQARMSEIQAENARLRGSVETLVPMFHQRQQQAVPAAPDPAALKREAKKALDSGNFDEWDRLNDAATEARFRAMIPQQQQYAPQPPPIPPHLQMMMMQHPAVVNAGNKGINLAIVEDQRLALMGVPDGPERYQKAFQLAANALSPNSAAAYSQDSRGALSGIPNARSTGKGAGSGESGVVLSAYEIHVAEKCGMTKAEYAQHVADAHPERLKNG